MCKSSNFDYDEGVGRYSFCLLVFLPLLLQARIYPFDGLESAYRNKIIFGEPLVLSGVAVHRRFVFDVYELALYLKAPSHKSKDIIHSLEVKYARMKFLRDLTAEEIRDGFSGTFKDNCLTLCESLKPQMDELLASIPDMKNGELIEFVFLTDKTIISGSNQKSLVFPGVEFGKLFLRSWVGDTPPSERFKHELLRNS